MPVDSNEELLGQAKSLLEAKQYAEAQGRFEELAERDSQSPEAWRGLGLSHQHLRERLDAVRAFRRLLEIDPRRPDAWLLLGNAYFQANRLEKALRCSQQLLRLDPSSFLALRLRGSVLSRLGLLDEARQSCELALKLRPEEPQNRILLGMLQLAESDCQDGWDLYESRHDCVKTDWAVFRAQEWEGQSLDGKTIVLLSEQGLGDTIQFARYASELKRRFNCQVWLFCRTGLIPLLGSLASVNKLLGNHQPPPPCDFYLPLMSLPRFVSVDSVRDPKCCPYLAPSPERSAKWQRRLPSQSSRLRVGLVWRGNPEHDGDRFRSLTPSRLGPLGRWDDVEWISLQKEATPEELNEFPGRLHLRSFDDLDDGGGIFEDTAALIKQLDLVITVDTAIAHLAGALGRPVWIALAYSPDWRWGQSGDKTDWYPSARLFRQPSPGDWDSVMEAMCDALDQHFGPLKVREPDDYSIASVAGSSLVAARHGWMLTSPVESNMALTIRSQGEFAEEETQVLCQLAPQDGVALQVGAKIGAQTVPLAKKIGELGWVHAVEQDRASFQALNANLALNGLTNVETHRMEAEQLQLERLALADLHLIATDLKGLELEFLSSNQAAVERMKPQLYLRDVVRELAPDLIQFLSGLGYDCSWHSPPLHSARNHFRNPSVATHQVTPVNLVAKHRSNDVNLTGFLAVTSPGHWPKDSDRPRAASASRRT